MCAWSDEYSDIVELIDEYEIRGDIDVQDNNVWKFLNDESVQMAYSIMGEATSHCYERIWKRFHA